MLDLIGALVMGVIFAADVIVLVGLAAIRPAAKVAAFVFAGAWFSLIVGIATLGGFATGAIGAVPAPPLAFLALISFGLVSWFAWPAFRRALLSVPLAGLVGMNASRVAGVFFLILYERGRLASPFAISAGWGDIITGLVAIPLAIWIDRMPRWLPAAWTAFGAADLIVAIGLGALSAPGTPFQVFRDAPGTAAMGALPWVSIPVLLVPMYLMALLAIAVRLRGAELEEKPRGFGDRGAGTAVGRSA